MTYQSWRKVHGRTQMSGAGFIVPPAAASFVAGFNFRATSGFVTDGANETYVIATDVYPTTRGGVTFGVLANTYWQYRDRDNTNDRRLSGLAFQDTGSAAGDELRFRVDVTPGTYSLEVAAGDDFGAQHVAYVIKDSTTTRFTFTDTTTSGADAYLDTEGAEYTNATWPGSHGTHTGIVISSGIFIFELTNLAAVARVITHIKMTQTA